MKKICIFISICIAVCLSLTTIDATTYNANGTLNSSYLIGYQYNYYYSASIGYDNPGDGEIDYFSNMSLSNKVCDKIIVGKFGCIIETYQKSKTLTSTKAAVVYIIHVEVSTMLGIASYMYVGSKDDKITISSPGPRSNTVSIEEGEMYYDLDDANKYTK